MSIKIHFYDVLLYDSDFIVSSLIRPEWPPRLTIQLRQSLHERHKSHMEEMTRWTADLLDESEDRLDRLLKKARNTEEVASGPLVIPEDVFRDSGEEKEITWIKSVMRVCSPGGEIEVRELVDLLGSYHKLTKDTIRSNVMSIVKDAAVIKKGVIKYIKGISKYVPPCMIQIVNPVRQT